MAMSQHQDYMMTSSNGNLFPLLAIYVCVCVEGGFDVFFDLRLNKWLSR